MKRKFSDSQIYFMRAQNTGLIKIGWSRDPGRRLSHVRYEIKGRPVELLASAPGDWGTEQQLHWLFRSDRMHGEWFRPSLALYALIDFILSFNAPPSIEELAAAS